MSNYGISGEELDIVLKNTFTFLDEIDLKPYIKEYTGRDIRELMKYLSLKEELDYIFNRTSKKEQKYL